MSGQKIIDGLKDAIEGDFTSVIIEGQKWVRADALHADQQEIMRINNTLRAALGFIGELAEEEIPHARVGTGAKVVLRHIIRCVHETVS